MSYLSADDILNAKDTETREVEVPEWGGVVLVRGLSGREFNAYQASTILIRGKEQIPNLDNSVAKLVGRAIINEDGTRVFTDQQINALGDKSSVALMRVFKIVAEMSGIAEDSLNEALENLGDVPSDSFTSS